MTSSVTSPLLATKYTLPQRFCSQNYLFNSLYSSLQTSIEGDFLMKTIIGETFIGERSLFQANKIAFLDCAFGEGESPLKHANNLQLEKVLFSWKYPLWFSNEVSLFECTLEAMARAGIWYSSNISIRNSIIDAPKTFRKANNVLLENVDFTNGADLLWNCSNISICNVTVNNGNYFCMHGQDIEVDNLTLNGDYGFDSAKRVSIRNSILNTKDAFWNCEDVTIYNSTIIGEYIAWNSKNITLIDCTVESLQGFCYVENLVMRNCCLAGTTLAFEFSTVDIEITHVDSVKNPSAGKIVAKTIGHLIMETKQIDTQKTIISTKII